MAIILTEETSMGSFVSKPASRMPRQEVIDIVKQYIQSDKVVIFSKTYCPYCTMAKKAFEALQQKTTCIELDSRDDAPEIQEVLGEITGATSVPRVFVNGNFIGGGTDVKKMQENGSLQALLAQ